jgi:hypothetical protein
MVNTKREVGEMSETEAKSVRSYKLSYRGWDVWQVHVPEQYNKALLSWCIQDITGDIRRAFLMVNEAMDYIDGIIDSPSSAYAGISLKPEIPWPTRLRKKVRSREEIEKVWPKEMAEYAYDKHMGYVQKETIPSVQNTILRDLLLDVRDLLLQGEVRETH